MGERCELHDMTMEQLKTYQQNQMEIAKSMTDIRERVTRVEDSTKLAHHRLDAQEEQTKAIYELAYEVKTYAKQQDQIIAQQGEIIALINGHGDRLTTLEKAPGESLLSYWKLFIGALVTGAAGYVIAMLSTNTP